MSVMEQHYRVMDLSNKWGVDRSTIKRHLPQYMHLIPDFNRKRRSRMGPIKRPYQMLRIPQSVAERIYRDIMSERAA